MNEPEPGREPDQLNASNSEFLVAGIIGGAVILLVVLLFRLFGIFNYGMAKALAGCLLVSLIGAIPGMLIGVKVLSRFKKQESLGAMLIVNSAISGIVGGAVIAGVLTPCIALGIECC